MLQIDNKIISLDIFEKQFLCDLDQCFGACCVHGDSGAPVEEEEAVLLERDLQKIMPYLSAEGQRALREQGVAVIDHDNELVTPLIGEGAACAYAYHNKQGVCLCGVEKAYRDKKISFHKPISCHLYPIRLRNFGETVALNYDQWSICSPAREKGKKEGLPVFRLLRDPLIRRFGQEFYDQLEDAYKHLQENPL